MGMGRTAGGRSDRGAEQCNSQVNERERGAQRSAASRAWPLGGQSRGGAGRLALVVATTAAVTCAGSFACGC